MKKILYSKASFEDLLHLKYRLIEDKDALATMITLNMLVDEINRLDENFHQGLSVNNFISAERDYLFMKSQGQIVFYRVLDDTIFIDRILKDDLEYVKILNVFEDGLYVDS